MRRGGPSDADDELADCILGNGVAVVPGCWVKSWEEEIRVSEPEGESPQKS